MADHDDDDLDEEIDKDENEGEDDETIQTPEFVAGDVVPWPEPVDGVALLDDLTSAFRRHLSLDQSVPEALALWSVYSHAIEAAEFAPRLLLKSPLKQCGKSTALNILGVVCRRPCASSSITPAALFRSIDIDNPTVIIDEADISVAGNRELAGLINSGHHRSNAHVRKFDVTLKAVRRFSTFAPIAFGCIGGLTDTIEDRSIIIRMRRKARHEQVEKFRLDRVNDLKDLARMAARWTIDNIDILREADPEMPDRLSDRAQDNWRMLIAIADTAGGEWPQRARDAALTLSAGPSDTSPAEVLLGDIRDIMGSARKIKSAALVEALNGLEDRPWSGLTGHSLAALLAPFGIKPKVMRFAGDSVHRGYERDGVFDDAIARYAAQTETPKEPVTTRNPVTAPAPAAVSAEGDAVAEEPYRRKTPEEVREAVERTKARVADKAKGQPMAEVQTAPKAKTGAKGKAERIGQAKANDRTPPPESETVTTEFRSSRTDGEALVVTTEHEQLARGAAGSPIGVHPKVYERRVATMLDLARGAAGSPVGVDLKVYERWVTNFLSAMAETEEQKKTA